MDVMQIQLAKDMLDSAATTPPPDGIPLHHEVISLFRRRVVFAYQHPILYWLLKRLGHRIA